MAILSLTVHSSSASPIYSLSGGFNDATAGSNLLLSDGSAVNDPVGEITSGMFNDLTLEMGSSSILGNVISGISILAPASLSISTGGDTVTFGFGEAEATLYMVPLGFTTLYYGIVQAPITSVAVSGSDPDTPTLITDLAPFLNPDSMLVLTYNGIDLTTGGAIIPNYLAPSASFTLLANDITAPEPSSAILTLSGGMAIVLRKLARQLRRRKLIVLDESPGP
jgi:hypothetical protein